MQTGYTEYHAHPTTEPRPPETPPSAWAEGGITFAACLLLLAGVFQTFAGFVALVDDGFYDDTRDVLGVDVTAWGWAHLLIGVLLLGISAGLFKRALWSGLAAVGVVLLSAIVNFLMIPYYPVWALVVIGLDVFVLWALTRPGAFDRR